VKNKFKWRKYQFES